ncbi:MAG: hypothetical protein ACI9XO_000631 [Paraglaciecola sp.]|jgi:hypothetical protein
MGIYGYKQFFTNNHNYMPFYFSQHSAPLLFGFLQGLIYALLLLFMGLKKTA